MEPLKCFLVDNSKVYSQLPIFPAAIIQGNNVWFIEVYLHMLEFHTC